MTSKSSIGGSASAGGIEYQAKVSAWLAVHILAEQSAVSPWEFAGQVDWLSCETSHSLDDLFFKTTGGGVFFAQIKVSVGLSASPKSAFRKSIDQCVGQFLLRDNGRISTAPQRDLDPHTDRLLLITSPRSPAPVRVHLRSVLRRIRTLKTGQHLGDLTLNGKEQEALEKTLSAISQSWRQIRNVEPTPQTVQQLLSLMEVQILDLDEDGVDTRQAKNILLTSVVQEPTQADAAWTKLIHLCTQMMGSRSGANRKSLQDSLLRNDISLQAPRSYKRDIERLRTYSSELLRTLAPTGRLRIGDSLVAIQRPSTERLRLACERQSLLVVGEPGAGKSGALHSLATALHADRRDYVLLAIDHIAARSLSELKNELGLEHDLLSVLDNWPGNSPAHVIVDALDASRGDPAGNMVRALLRRILESNSRWQVVASIRAFDLRYGTDIKDLFLGAPPTPDLDPELKDVRHVRIPKLSEEELEQVGKQSPHLLELINAAPPSLHELLRVPFNLRLLAELLNAGLPPSSLTPIVSQLELLDKYWHHRVLAGPLGDAGEAVLTKCCQEMVGARSLRVDRARLRNSSSSSQALDYLLRNEVLIEATNRYILAFAHNVLFDYAVERLLLRQQHEGIPQHLLRQPDLFLVVRPSIFLHFRHLWTLGSERSAFWSTLIQFEESSEIPEVGKLIGPTVLAELATILSDLEPLATSLQAMDGGKKKGYEQILRHLVGALLISPTAHTVIGQKAGPWAAFLDHITKTLSQHIAYAVRPLLSAFCDSIQQLTPAQLRHAGLASRRLLEYAWDSKLADHWFVTHAIQFVCRTFASDISASQELLKRCLAPSRLPHSAVDELPCLAREIEQLLPHSPTLVEEIYRTTFSHIVDSEELRTFYPSQILPLRSSASQEYGMAHYALADAFPIFLQAFPEHATKALLSALHAYVSQRHAQDTDGDYPTLTFEWGGAKALVRGDWSGVWDENGTSANDDALKMLGAYQEYIECSAQNDDIDAIRSLLTVLTATTIPAVVCRRLLIAGAKFPATLAHVLFPLVLSPDILSGFDTTTPAGEFLRASFQHFSPTHRESIERAVLSIPTHLPDQKVEVAEHIRNRLLGCLPRDLCASEDTRLLLTTLTESQSLPPNDPPVKIRTGWGPGPDEADYLRSLGVPTDQAQNRALHTLAKPVKTFEEQHLNSTPTIEQMSEVFPHIETLFAALHKAPQEGVHERQSNAGWNALAGACAKLARIETLNQTKGYELVISILQEASKHPDPQPNELNDKNFDNSPGWGPAARIHGADGLITLISHVSKNSKPDSYSDAVLESIERLSADPVPAVRYHIARRANALYYASPELMWRLLERLAATEKSGGVLEGALSGPLNRLASPHPEKVARLTINIYQRFTASGPRQLREFCLSILAGLHVWRNQPLASQVISRIAAHPSEDPQEAQFALQPLREALTEGQIQKDDEKVNQVRHRAIAFVGTLLRNGTAGIRRIEGENRSKPFSEWTEPDKDRLKGLYQLVDSIGSEMYFASGAYSDGKRNQKALNTVGPASERFYREASEVLDLLADSGLPSVIHHLLEILEFFIPVDPAGVFIRIGRAIRAGERVNYQHETLAADLLVGLVERFLAEQRVLLRENEACRKALIDILDVFVTAGWPKARRLTYRLEEIFR